MMTPNYNRSFRVILTILFIFSLAACASYPDDPRTPQPGDDTYIIEEDSFLNVSAAEGILINDKPREGTRVFLLTVGEIPTDNGGIINMAEDGSFTYEPRADFNGPDQAVYTIRNEKGKTSNSTIFFDVTPVNDAPRPVDDHAVISEGGTVTIDVLANDVEPDGDAMTVSQTGQPGRGNVRINGDGTLTYTPQANHSGDVTFSYTVSDGNGETAQAWVFITVGSGWAQPDSLTLVEDGSLRLPVSSLLANDVNPDNSGALTVIEMEGAQHGAVVLNGDGSFTYTPIANYSGTDTFIYTVQSPSGRTASATVTVTITATPDPPTISNIADVTIAQATSTDFIEFTVNDPDPDLPLEDLIVTAVVTDSTPVNLIPVNAITIGSGLNNIWTIRITPAANLFGAATIAVTVSDGALEASDAFILTVTPINGAPTISTIADQATMLNTPITVNFRVGDDATAPADLIVNATSSNQALVADADIIPDAAGPNRSITIIPGAGQTGASTITVSVSDGVQVTQTSFQLTVTIAPNTAPVIGPIENQQTALNTPLTVPFTVGDSETDPAALSLTFTSSNQTLAPDGNIEIGGSDADRFIRVTPTADLTGTTEITIRVSDGELSAERSFELQVASDSNDD